MPRYVIVLSGDPDPFENTHVRRSGLTAASRTHGLDAQCDLGRQHGHPDTKLWVDTMRERASPTGMRELTIRSMLHVAALGNQGDATAAAILAADIDNPMLDLLLNAEATRPIS